MTDNKSIKALKELLETALYNGDLQSTETISKALDLINRQQQENRQLQLKLDDCERDIIPKLKYSLERANKYGVETDAENIRLLKENEKLQGEIKEKTETIVFLKDQATGWSIDFCNLENKVKTVKAEAIKDFAKRLKECTYDGGSHPTVWDEFACAVDNLAKEMIGEQE